MSVPWTGPFMLEESSLRRSLRQAKAGDAVAFEFLVRQHERVVLRTAHRLLGNLEDAKDAAQEVFLRLHKHLGSVREDVDLIHWLYRATVNVCIDSHRKAKRNPAVEPSLSLIDDSLSPEAQFVQSEQRVLIFKALSILTPKERATIVLRDLENRTTAEVAKILGSSEATVRSQISSARIKIRTFVEGRRRRDK